MTGRRLVSGKVLLLGWAGFLMVSSLLSLAVGRCR